MERKRERDREEQMITRESEETKTKKNINNIEIIKDYY